MRMHNALIHEACLAFFLAGSLCAGAAPVFLDLRAVANTAIEDDGIADNGAGGWSDEGANDMFIYPPVQTGIVTRGGYRFNIAPAAGCSNSVIMLRGQERGTNKPGRVTVSVPKIAGSYLYVLQNSVGSVAGMPKNYTAATYTITYADGTTNCIALRDGIELRPWWTREWWDNSGRASWPVFMGGNAYSGRWKSYVGVWAFQWRNPRPAEPIKAITFSSAGKAAPVIWAVTIADEDFHGPESRRRETLARPAAAPLGYFDGKLAAEREALFAAGARENHFKGVRSVELIRNDIIAVTVDAALGRIGAGPGEEIIARYQTPATFTIKSDTDPAFSSPVHPARVGRLSCEHWNGDVGAFPQNVLYWHTFYLVLPAPLKSGNAYSITVNGIEPPFTASSVLSYDERTTTTPVIKINQTAYAPGARQRFAYLGWWAGDMGTVDYAMLTNYQVVSEADGKVVLEGKVARRARNDALSGEDVCEMDLSAVRA
ncbi:hypothetical protein GX586_04505, partial [bacterium]|nr:hypothetical protein [bacterium]